MFGLNENTQYYVCQRYVRMNMGINGLYQIVRTEMELPPLGGAVFIFFSKNRQQVKMLKWDGDGFLLYQKRLRVTTLIHESIVHSLNTDISALYSVQYNGWLPATPTHI